LFIGTETPQKNLLSWIHGKDYIILTPHEDLKEIRDEILENAIGIYKIIFKFYKNYVLQICENKCDFLQQWNVVAFVDETGEEPVITSSPHDLGELTTLSGKKSANKRENIFYSVRSAYLMLNTTITKIPKPVYIGLCIDKKDQTELNKFVKNIIPNNKKDNVLYNHHITLEYKPKDLNKSIKPNTQVYANITKLVIRKSDNAAAFFVKSVSVDDKEIESNNNLHLHITAQINKNQKPAISKEFVGLNDDTVEIISYKKTIKTTCFWEYYATPEPSSDK
jgi:hypothetical protein